ncbi:MAG TPA: HEXXH motif domain-containing protein [Micromonosporaceae bacterium]|nr:HEXXH motif domain-containing protein [Micromonosporaceae bacterium]HCU48787.1 HEXXH motif domain-containing protein [Micromonosporaceae bacterium]
MDIFDELFSHTAIEVMRRERTDQIRALLNGNPAALDDSHVPGPTTALDYVIAHHRLEAAEQAARRQSIEDFELARRNGASAFRSMTVQTACGDTIVVEPAAHELLNSEVSDSPFYLVTMRATDASEDGTRLAVNAFGAATDLGFGALLGNHAKVVCLLAKRTPPSAFNSWTITRLPGTVFTDYSHAVLLLARDLIHEAGHNWLNDLLTATKLQIPQQQFYSPWKRTHRPAFGFIHATWAFPLTMIFAARAIDTAPDEVAHYLRTYLARQREMLAATQRDHPAAMELVEDHQVRQRLTYVFDLAQQV